MDDDWGYPPFQETPTIPRSPSAAQQDAQTAARTEPALQLLAIETKARNHAELMVKLWEYIIYLMGIYHLLYLIIEYY